MANEKSSSKSNSSYFLALIIVVIAVFGTLLNYNPHLISNYISPNTTISSKDIKNFDLMNIPVVKTTGVIVPKSTSSLAIVGGGLAGLSAAVEAVDSLHSEVFSRFLNLANKHVGGNSEKNLAIYLTYLKSLSLEERKALMTENNELSTLSSLLSDFQVILLEKEKNLGGNSMKASSGMNAVNTVHQQHWYSAYNEGGDSETLFVQDTAVSCVSSEPPLWHNTNSNADSHTDTTSDMEGDRNYSPLSKYHWTSPLSSLSPFTSSLVHQIVKNSAQAVYFLEDSKHSQSPKISTENSQLLEEMVEFLHLVSGEEHQAGKDNPTASSQPPSLFLSNLSRLGGHKATRTHRPGPNPEEKPLSAEESAKKPSKPLMPVGVSVVSTLRTRLNTFPYNKHVSVHTGVVVDDIIRCTHSHSNNVAVCGIRYTNTNTNTNTNTDTNTDTKTSFTFPISQVILTTGGYAAAPAILSQYNPTLASLHLPTTNGHWASGDSIHMLTRNGAQENDFEHISTEKWRVPIDKEAQAGLVGMSAVQVHPTSFVDLKTFNANTNTNTTVQNFLAPEALRGVGGILINAHGRRFVNELNTRDHVARAIYWQPLRQALLVMSQEMVTEFGAGVIGFYKSKGFIREIVFSDSALSRSEQVYQGLLDYHPTLIKSGVDAEDAKAQFIQSLQLTFDSYSTDSKDEFGRASKLYGASLLSSPSLYVMTVTPALHYSMGGLAIDSQGRVLSQQALTTREESFISHFNTLSKDDVTKMIERHNPDFDTIDRNEWIGGLWAAGEASGGVHGKNRLGGNSLLECVVIGRVSAQDAIKTIITQM